MKNLYAFLVLSSVAALFAMPGTSRAGTYAVDTSFANSGVLNLPFPGSDFRTLAHLARPDGTSIAITTYDNNGCPAGRHCFALYTFDAAGHFVDDVAVPTSMSFSKLTGGIVLDPYLVKAAAIDSQNRIVIAGTEQLGPVLQFKVIRLLPNGQPDTSFDGDGIATPGDFSAQHEAIAEAMAIDGSDRIIVAGRATLSANDSDFAILRLTSAGALDTSFNTTGKKTIFFDLDGGGGLDGATAVAIRPGGQIYLAGYAVDAGVSRIALAKLLPSGTLDGNFCPTTCTYQGPYTGVNNGKRVLYYGDVADNQNDYVKSADVNVSGEFVYAGTHEAGPGDFRVFAQKVALNGDYANEGEVQLGFTGSTYYVGGIRYFNRNSGISDLVLTGSAGPNGEYFFAQGLDGALVPILNWGTIGENTSVLLYTAALTADWPGDLPGIPSVDAQARVLVGGSFKATSSDQNYSITVSRLRGDVIFRNGFE